MEKVPDYDADRRTTLSSMKESVNINISIKSESPLSPSSSNSSEAAPRYSDLHPRDVANDLTAGFASLALDKKKGMPTVDECIAHLKLLEAFSELRGNVGMQDGLYGLSDSLAMMERGPMGGRVQDKLLAKMREKRWSIYVVQAARRFARWFQALESGKGKITIQRMEQPTYADVHVSSPPLEFNHTNLPPLDVLMVWHAFILSPRNYLSDCIRHNRIGLWRAGIPWASVTASIDNHSFAYQPGATARENFTRMTGLPWDCRDMQQQVALPCPKCDDVLSVPLTTTSRPHWWQSDLSGTALGEGYADTDFRMTCPCGALVNHEMLRAKRFSDDLTELVSRNTPMPGTLLNLKGLASSPATRETMMRGGDRTSSNFQAAFPNRLLLHGTGIDPSAVGSLKTVSEIRKLLETSLKQRTTHTRIAAAAGGSGRPDRSERIAVRQMMSSYWDNASLFSLDLVGAVVRQSVFVQKMHKIDWLHSPALRNTADRLIHKYMRFMSIIKTYPGKVVVPTLDVDLAWHTHQLNTEEYRLFGITNTGKFINHDDKIEANSLSKSFEWTSKVYQETYNLVYAECTCWYCEAVRESHTARLTRLTSPRLIRGELERLHSPSRKSSRGDTSAHISAHNAIQARNNPDKATARYVKEQQLERSYQKVVQRAKKQGRPPPERDAVYTSWGYTYTILPYYAPYMGDPCLSYGLYPAEPGCADFAVGANGNCCSGTCGNGGCGGGGGVGTDGGGDSGGGSNGGCSGGGGCGGGCGGCG